jgi:predicted NBD/HSP70 family sugar kinase
MSSDEADRLVSATPAEAVDVIAAAGARGSPRAVAGFAAAGVALGRAVDDVIGTLNPDAVILGGYLGVLAPYLVDTVEPVLTPRLDVAAFGATRLVTLKDSERHVVLGAALAARDACLYDPLTWTRSVGR